MNNDQLTVTFAALADPTRRSILARLAQGEATVNELAAPFSISLQAVSKHLKVPERAQLAAWWGKRGWTARLDSVELDVRPGGNFRVTTVNDADGSEMTNEGT